MFSVKAVNINIQSFLDILTQNENSATSLLTDSMLP